MNFKSKRILANMIFMIILIIIYISIALKRNMPGAEPIENLREWAILILIFIAIAIVTGIVSQILFHIAFSVGIAIKEKDSSDSEVIRIIESAVKEDEMDKAINLKSEYIGLIIVGIGFIASLFTIVFGMSAVFALNFMFAMFVISAFASGIASIIGFERGI